MALSEMSDSFSWHDEQQEIASTILHHAFGCYVDDINGLRHEMYFQDRVNLTQQMLSTIDMVKSSDGWYQIGQILKHCKLFHDVFLIHWLLYKEEFLILQKD
ncbi:hypothetical protein LINPERHAP1_LOCUS39525 [Linum perenne]